MLRLSPSLVLCALLLGCGDDDGAKIDSGPVIDAAPVVDSGPVIDGNAATNLVANHTVIASYDTLPTTISGLNVIYRHTSHGSQLTTGLGLLGRSVTISEPGSDLGADPDFEATTRADLGATGNGYNVVVWSWCGQVSSSTEESINTYLSKMSALEADYPNITFVYMTGHLDGSGADGNLRIRNQQIRDYCAANNKVLFDFEDIESYDPAGTYYVDGSDACEWCTDWCTAHGDQCVDCSGGCAHSHCFNCQQKGKAFWWLLQQIAAR
jgi:hypothetical protein